MGTTPCPKTSLSPAMMDAVDKKCRRWLRNFADGEEIADKKKMVKSEMGMTPCPKTSLSPATMDAVDKKCRWWLRNFAGEEEMGEKNGQSKKTSQHKPGNQPLIQFEYLYRIDLNRKLKSNGSKHGKSTYRGREVILTNNCE
ncbi:Uncharacterized protein Fot_23179 [Forsythia ovata]|uniref:Uncharacterized protein n=1 Tax=Forsythia ovata TaxID=205694 RepID=A0ABD1UZU2_9LAMI